ncbi:GNAT family N-acetyltransferase [Saccharothrix longispora]|uniref:GNAT family N-acetyltransferase n=1 Tax=Saccharothrix longispora TaxID=33920 RepID=UPI0028FDA61A|nr:GNAT family N-acetyltransferase [Saccharothrix longispora]MDU0290941.1 GNAT family N-acetyltransferase [Saccharothrix longispora]
MLTDTLPAGFVSRPAAIDDAETVLALVRAYTTAVAGFADCTLADVRDELGRPGRRPERDAWLVFDAAGAPVGYGTADARDGGEVDVDVVSADPAVVDWLFARALDRAREVGREAGHAEVRVDQGVHRDDEALRTTVTALGFAPATTFRRMRVDHDGDVPPPAPVAGLVLRQALDEDVRRAVHAVWNASFAGQFGFTPKSYEAWHEKLEGKSTSDWAEVWLAELDGAPAGFLECTDQFRDEGSGYVGHLGVVPAARGRGVAGHLLRHAFHRHAAAGLGGTLLHVDSNNPTPALDLYESAGMRTVLVIDVWRATLPTAQDVRA